jgi:hypothetical protein
MGVTGAERQRSAEGLQYAHPAMMALSNLLSHPRLGPETMGEAIGGRVLRRASKDLGRVLALAWLAGRDETERWTGMWEQALREVYVHAATALAAQVGTGLRQLLDDPAYLDEARHAAAVGLLSGFGITNENLRAVGHQLLVDAIERLERA